MSEPKVVQEPEYVSTLIPDDKTGQAIRHVLRFPPDGTEEQMYNNALPLGCDSDVLVFGRRRQVVYVSEIDCPNCRKLTGW